MINSLEVKPTVDHLIGEFLSTLYAHTPTNPILAAILMSDFPALTNTSDLICSMNADVSFMQGKTSDNVATLLDHVQSADPASVEIDEDNKGESWGHYQFTAANISPSSLLTTWQEISNVSTAFKLVAATIKTCREARMMCMVGGTPKMNGLISDVYLEMTLDHLKDCWVKAGGVSFLFIQ